MNAHAFRSWVTAGLLAVGAASSSACYVDTEPEVVYADGYRPVYYDGYMVYYDPGGRPYYYVNGAAVWVAPGSPVYPRLVAHWNTYGRFYGHWYGHYGYHYRTWRGRR